jgi:predicted nuclease of predicted toxin-antitoxin system
MSTYVSALGGCNATRVFLANYSEVFMPWRPLDNPNPDDIGPEFKRKTRFLVDESLGVEVARYLRGKGYNTLFVADVDLDGHSDEDIFAYAWREKRMLWTHDRDFLDDARFPEHRNRGVVVLPGGDGDNQAMGIGVGTALQVFGAAPSIWEKTKSAVSPTGEVTIRRRNFDTGKIETKPCGTA